MARRQKSTSSAGHVASSHSKRQQATKLSGKLNIKAPKRMHSGIEPRTFPNATYVCAVALVAVAVYLYKDFLTEFDAGIIKRNGSSYGGWRTASEGVLGLYDTAFCNIERRNADQLTAAEFERTYRFKKPVIVSFNNGARDWINPDEWTVESLKRAYGNKWVRSGNGREIVRHGGSGYVESSFVEYVDGLMGSSDDVGEPL